jgi:hypothetical protein
MGASANLDCHVCGERGARLVSIRVGDRRYEAQWCPAHLEEATAGCRVVLSAIGGSAASEPHLGVVAQHGRPAH